MVTSSSSPAYDSPQESWWYDVFLSFRGEDTRKSFTSHLFSALKNHGFNTFHDTLLPRGQEIAGQLLKAIEQSQLSIVVFSKNYAESRWCLDELVKINDCRKSHSGQEVLPVFLDVKPSDVRKQEGCYKQPFLHHCRPGSKFTQEITNRWKEALFDIGNLSGHHLQNDANGDEAEFVRQIVTEVAFILKRPRLHVAEHPVGIEPRVRTVCSLLDAAGLHGAGIVVIWGIGGIGKTTIAKATFNFLGPRFEGCSFLADVRSTFGQADGVVKLQKQLICNIRNEKNAQDVVIHNHHEGTQRIKSTICNRRVLLVVDDVDKAEQLEKLAITREYLHSGSRVLVTTRDLSCTVNLGLAAVYKSSELNKEDSLKLFTSCAVGNVYPYIEGYEDLLEQVYQLSGGIPLVLKVWGPHFRMYDVEKWNLVLKKLRKVPHGDVQAKLRISYDSLDDGQKSLFLDIACFFNKMEKGVVIGVLKDEASEWDPELEIEMLLRRRLAYLDFEVGRLQILMHDVIRDMGREIVRQESPKDLGKRTRLWDRHDVLSILNDCSGTKAVESISFANPLSESDDVSVKVKALKKLRNLRLLHFRNVQISGTYNGEISFMKLKCLRWFGFPLKCLPTNLNVSNLVALKLKYSKLEQLWEGTKEMNKLRFLDVSHSINLIKTPNFSGVRSIEVLKLRHCTNLEEVDDSVLCLDKLVLLDLSSCEKLRIFPFQSIFKLRYLEKLRFFGCRNYFPCEGTPFRLLPDATGLGHCLTDLDVSNCNLSHVPSEIGSLESLKNLSLSWNSFSSLPDSLSSLHRLQSIDLECCVNLHSIPVLPRNLSHINAIECSSLTNLPRMVDLQSLSTLLLCKCVALKTIPYLPGRLEFLHVGGCLSLEKIPITPLSCEVLNIELSNCPILEQDSYNHTLRRFLVDSYKQIAIIPRFTLELTGTEFPRLFNYQCAGERIQFVAPHDVQGLIFCVINSPQQHKNGVFNVIVHVVNRSCRAENNSYRFESSGLGGWERYDTRMWVCHAPLFMSEIQVNRGDDVQIQFTLMCRNVDKNLYVEKCGVRLIYEHERIDDQKITEWMNEDIMDSQPPPHYEDQSTSDLADDVLGHVGNIGGNDSQYSASSNLDNVFSSTSDNVRNRSTRLMAYLVVFLIVITLLLSLYTVQKLLQNLEELSLA